MDHEAIVVGDGSTDDTVRTRPRLCPDPSACPPVCLSPEPLQELRCPYRCERCSRLPHYVHRCGSSRTDYRCQPASSGFRARRAPAVGTSGDESRGYALRPLAGRGRVLRYPVRCESVSRRCLTRLVHATADRPLQLRCRGDASSGARGFDYQGSTSYAAVCADEFDPTGTQCTVDATGPARYSPQLLARSIRL